jgi:hypothetical protein
MSVRVRKSLISSLKSTSNGELSLNTVYRINFRYALSIIGTNGCGKHCWNSWGVQLLGFLWSYLTRWFALKIVSCNVVGFVPKCAWVTCRFGPFVMQHPMINVVFSFSRSLNAQLSSRSSNLYVYYCVSMESSFILFSIMSSIRSLLTMTKVGLWLSIVVCFK